MYRANTLWIQDYSECNKEVLDVGATAMPGKIVAIQDRATFSTVLSVDREYFQPDTCLVVSSGVDCVPVGAIVVPRPGAIQTDTVGAYWKNTKDGREVRIFGLPDPWYWQLCGFVDRSGFHPYPGWGIWETEEEDSVIDRVMQNPVTGVCVESCGDGFLDPLNGQRTVLPDGFKVKGKDWIVAEAPIVSKGFLTEITYGSNSVCV